MIEIYDDLWEEIIKFLSYLDQTYTLRRVNKTFRQMCKPRQLPESCKQIIMLSKGINYQCMCNFEWCSFPNNCWNIYCAVLEEDMSFERFESCKRCKTWGGSFLKENESWKIGKWC